MQSKVKIRKTRTRKSRAPMSSKLSAQSAVQAENLPLGGHALLLSKKAKEFKKLIPPDLVSFGPVFLNHPQLAPFFVTPCVTEDQNWPAVASDGKDFLVIWTQNAYQTELWGARISGNGYVLDPKGFLINTVGFHRFPRVAFGKDPKTGKGDYLVVWQRWEEHNQRHKILGALVTTAGKVHVRLADTYPDASAKYGVAHKVQKLSGTQAVNSDGIHIFPDIKNHWNQWQDYGPLESFGPPQVDFNGTDFAVLGSGHGIIRLVEPGTGLVKRAKKKEVPVYPLGKPYTIEVGNPSSACLTARLATGGGKQGLVTWFGKLSKPGVWPLWGAKLTFTGTGASVGKPKKIADYCQVNGHCCEVASSGTGNYFLGWHDITNKRKANGHGPSYPRADLYKSAITAVTGKPKTFDKAGWSVLYPKKDFGSYYPNVAFDGNNYLLVWESGGTYLKNVWMKEQGMYAGEVDTESKIFWDPISPGTKSKLVQSLSCMADFSILGTYFSGYGQSVESFGILARDQGPGYYGLIHGTPEVCFSKNYGLLVYRWLNTDAWDTKHPTFMIRARFIARTTFQVAKVGKLGKLTKTGSK
jgi:hypothetical protein